MTFAVEKTIAAAKCELLKGESIDAAVRSAGTAAAAARDAGAEDAATAALAACAAARAALAAAREQDAETYAAARAAAARIARESVLKVDSPGYDDKSAHRASIIADAVEAAARAAHDESRIVDAVVEASTYIVEFLPVVADAVRHDLQAILRRIEGATDDTPYPQEIFGPMWPDGAPIGWPAIEAMPEDSANSSPSIDTPQLDDVPSLRVTVELGEFFDADAVIEGLVELDDVLNHLSIDLGGSGLKLVRGESFRGDRIGEGVFK